MRELNVWDSNFNDKFIYYDDINKIINIIKDENINNFNVIDKYAYDDKSDVKNYMLNLINHNAKKKDIDIIYIDSNHNCFVMDGYIYFGKDFYAKYKQIIDGEIIKNILKSTFIVHVNNHIYNDKLVKLLADKGCKIKFDSDIYLSDEIKEYLKSKHVESYYYDSDGNKAQISSDKILKMDYKDVIDSKKESIVIDYDVTDLENLKYIPSNKQITIKKQFSIDNDVYEKDYYDNIYNIIKTLRENNQNNKIILEVENRKAFTLSKLFNSNYDIEIYGISLDTYSLKDLKEEEKILDLMVKDIKNSNYSPLEKYIAVYNIVKKFKQYKESEQNPKEARNVKYLLNNEYMVCVGYSNLLKELLRKVGIDSYKCSVGVDTSYDNGFTLEEKNVTRDGHARLIVSIDDPKYNIKGNYVADPTWDNNLIEDYYNHALISFDKTSKEKRFMYLTDEDLVLNVKSMEEFSSKINYLIKKLVYEARKFMTELNLSSKTHQELEIDAYKTIIKKIIDILAALYPLEYENKFKKYYDIFYKNKKIDDAIEFLSLVGNFFVNTLGKDVPIDTVLEAAVNVNKNVFNLDEEKLKIYKEELYEINKERELVSFPLYYEDEKSKTI